MKKNLLSEIEKIKSMMTINEVEGIPNPVIVDLIKSFFPKQAGEFIGFAKKSPKTMEDLKIKLKNIGDELGVTPSEIDDFFKVIEKNTDELIGALKSNKRTAEDFANTLKREGEDKIKFLKFVNKVNTEAVNKIRKNLVKSAIESDQNIIDWYGRFKKRLKDYIERKPGQITDPSTIDGNIVKQLEDPKDIIFGEWPEFYSEFAEKMKKDDEIADLLNPIRVEFDKIVGKNPGFYVRFVQDIPFLTNITDLIYRMVISNMGFKKPENFIVEVQKNMKTMLENFIPKALEGGGLTAGELDVLNLQIKQMMLDFRLSSRGESFADTWVKIKKSVLDAAKRSGEEDDIMAANEMIAICEKGVKTESGSVNKSLDDEFNGITSIENFLKLNKEKILVLKRQKNLKGDERSAFYSRSNFLEWTGLIENLKSLRDGLVEIRERYSNKTLFTKEYFIPLFRKIIWKVMDTLLGVFVFQAPRGLKKTLDDITKVTKGKINVRKLGRVPEVFVNFLKTWVRLSFMKLVWFPVYNMIETFALSVQSNWDQSVEIRKENEIETFMLGYGPIKGLDADAWTKIGIPINFAHAISIGEWVWEGLKNRDSSYENVQKINKEWEEVLSEILTKEQVEEVIKIEKADDRARRAKILMDKNIEELRQKLAKYEDIKSEIKTVKSATNKWAYLNDAILDLPDGVDIIKKIRPYFIFTDQTQTNFIAYTTDLKPLTLHVSETDKNDIYAKDENYEDTNVLYKRSDFGKFALHVYGLATNNKLLGVNQIDDAIKNINIELKSKDQPGLINRIKKLQTSSIIPTKNNILKEMEEGKKFGEDNFKHWKDTFKFKKYDEKTNQLKDVKITAKMDEIMDRIDHFRKKYDEDDSFVRAVIDVYGTGIDIIQYTKGLAHLTEGVIVGGLLGVLSTIRESKELVTWTVKHYKDGNWELVKGNFNKKELLNVGKTKRERDERQKESDNPAEGLKKKEQESIMILSRDEKEGLNGLPTKVKQKVKEKLRQGWTTEKPFDFLNTYYSESEINSVFNDKIKIYKLKPSAEFFRTLAKNSSKVTVKKGFCKSVKNAKGEYDLSEREKNTLNHFISKCESKFGV